VPAVSVIVPARDAEPTIGKALEALDAQSLGERYEIIVVDDGSRDRTPSVVGSHDRVRLIRSAKSAGPGAARNKGVAAARSPVLAFTDADCMPVVNWLEQGLAALEGADLVQGRVQPDPSVARTPFDRSLSVEDHDGFYQTANLFVRRETFDAVGGFADWALEEPGRRRWSEDRRRARAMRTPIGEDTLFAWRARRLGARSRFCPGALVHHAVVPGSLRDAVLDRWHWTRDMPGLVERVPELRATTLYHRWFFADWTAQFDLAVAVVVTGAALRRPRLAAGVLPYARRVWREASVYRDGRDSRAAGLSRAARYCLGAPVVDVTTLTGLVLGSIAWRSLVL
jgi:glycosyltransferase involved in cell wall biosynthesis